MASHTDVLKTTSLTYQFTTVCSVHTIADDVSDSPTHDVADVSDLPTHDEADVSDLPARDVAAGQFRLPCQRFPLIT